MSDFDFEKLACKAIANEKFWRPRCSEITPRSPDILWLDKNENTDPELSALTGKLLQALPPEVVFSYPELALLYKKLAAWAGTNAGINLEPNNILLYAGSDGAIRAVFEAFVERGDKVILTAPTFAMYPVYAQMYGAQSIVLEYQASSGGPELDLDLVLNVIRTSGAKLLCLPNPDSPTGTVFSESSLDSIIKSAASSNMLVLIDEAYHPFYEQSVVTNLASYPNLIVARTFSKAWGLAGARVGYTVSSHPLAGILNKVRPMYEVGALSASLVESMLDHPRSMLESVARLNAGKLYFESQMQRLGFKTLSGQGNFLHVAFKGKVDNIHQALAKRVYYRKDFKEACLAGYSRFSCAPQQIMQKVVEIIELEVSKDLTAKRCIND